MSIKDFFKGWFGKEEAVEVAPVQLKPKKKIKALTKDQRAKLAKKIKAEKLKLKKLKAKNLKKAKEQEKKLKKKGKKLIYDKSRYTRRKVGSDGQTYVYDSNTNDWLLLAAVAYIVFSSNNDHEFDSSGNLVTDPDDRGVDTTEDSSNVDTDTTDYDTDSSDYDTDGGMDSGGGDTGGSFD